MCRGPVGTALARAGLVVVSFNAEGRVGGRLDRRSGGVLDYSGERDQDGLATVIRYAAGLRGVDPAHIGIASVSFGLVAAVGCLARHPGLPVRWLVDEEGPADAVSALLYGWRLADIGERPDRAQKALDLFGRPLPRVGASTETLTFWAGREPVRSIGRIGVPYLRLQAELDHVQPPGEPEHIATFELPPAWWQGKHAVDLNNAAVAGGLPWVRVNLPAQGNPVGAVYSEARRPTWLPGRMTDHPAAMVEAVLEQVERASRVG